jgi:methylation protein EvaC
MRRHECAACGGTIQDFLSLGSTPLADRFPDSATARERWYTLTVAVCRKCWLVQLREVVDDRELYGADYAFRTASSPAAVDYFTFLAGWLVGTYTAQAKQLVVEIACNDGTMLENFAVAGCPNVVGVEPSGAAEDARQRGLEVVQQPFNAALAGMLRERHGPAGLVLAFNVAAHVASPADFLTGIRELLADDGVAVIEFQDVAALLAGCQYDHVYHEHRQFYSLSSFSRLARMVSLEVFHWDRTAAQGGSVRVHLRRSARAGTVLAEPWLDHMTVYEGMQDRVIFAKRKLLELVGAELTGDRIIAGYAANAKSCTVLNYCGLGPGKVQWMEDTTPVKIGRFTPGSRIPVIEPGLQTPDTYLLFAWNYLSRMTRHERRFLENGGRIILPGAVPVII